LSIACFVDNDAILKLVACDLFWDAIAILGVTQSDLRVLASAKYVFKGKKVKDRYTEEIRNAAIAVTEQCKQIEAELSEELKSIKIDGLDPGELILLSATKSEPAFYLVTGDKRCIAALSNELSLPKTRERLTGKVVCIEQLVLKLIYTQGFENVLAKVLPALEYDKALKACFGSGARSTEQNVALALQGYIAHLQQQAPSLLVDL
jgi:hypothetical protein